MSNQILAEMLVLGLLFIASARFIFVRDIGNDSLSLLPLVALLISAANLFVFSFCAFDVLIAILAFFIFLWNIRALLRLMSDLIVDQYSVQFRIVSSLNLILTVGMIAGLVYLRPMDSTKKKLGINETVSLECGTFEKGFNKIDRPFTSVNARVWRMEARNRVSPNKIFIVFIPPKTADVRHYSSFLYKLAYDGFDVIAADFYEPGEFWAKGARGSRFLRRNYFFLRKFKEEKEYESEIKARKIYFQQEFNALIKMLDTADGDMVFLVTDDDISGSMKALLGTNKSLAGCFDLSYAQDYQSAGYGPIENTDPLLALALKIQPDRSGYMSNHLGLAVKDFISDIFVADTGEN